MLRLSDTLPLAAHSLRAAARGLRRGGMLRQGTRTEQPRQLVFFSQVIWAHVWGRPQEIAERLSSHIPTVFVGMTPVNRMLEAPARWRAKETRCEGRLRVLSPLVVPGEYKMGVLRRFNAREAVKTLLRLEIIPEETVFLTNNPFVPEAVEQFPWGLVVYDWMDDFCGFQWAPRDCRLLERRVLSRAQLFTAGTQFLAETKRDQCGEIHFVPNGVRYEEFAAETPAPADLPAGFEKLAGYIGTLSDRFDVELIETLARALPQVGVVLIGPIHGSLGRPPTGRNVFHLGIRAHQELPAYVRRFDAGLIPFRTGSGSEAVNPTKLLEYAAAGVPVVSTALPDVQRLFSDCVAIGNSHEEFTALVRRGLSGDFAEQVEIARRRAREASWEAMSDRLWSLIADSWSRHAHRG